MRTAAASNYELVQTEHTLTSFSALERDQGTRATAVIFRPFWGKPPAERPRKERPGAATMETEGPDPLP